MTVTKYTETLFSTSTSHHQIVHTMYKKSFSPKAPRLDPQDRREKRFYEPLVLLHVLDRYGKGRVSRSVAEVSTPSTEAQDLRRDFLDSLAYTCDYEKGGDTVTAIALESRPAGLTYWIASNKTCTDKTLQFLGGIISTLRELSVLQSKDSIPSIEADLIASCIIFSSSRLRDYKRLLYLAIERCSSRLRESEDPAGNRMQYATLLLATKTLTDQILGRWLDEFDRFENNLQRLCNYAYNERKSDSMKQLDKVIGEQPAELTDEKSKRQDLIQTRHYIGRLGSHPRAVKILINAGRLLPRLFENVSIQRRPSIKPSLIPPPTDHHTTLEGIINRMLSKTSPDKARYTEALNQIDSIVHLQDRIDAQFKAESFRPRVHAELILLEYFYKQKLPFLDNDRYVGCSKPACYCCYQYIVCHPGRFVHPASHSITYLAWKRPDLLDPSSLEEQRHQIKLMNDITQRIRDDVLIKIDSYIEATTRRPDSLTGITPWTLREDSVEDENSIRKTASFL